MSSDFSSPQLGIVVAQRPDGTQSLSGQFRGANIKAAHAIDGGNCCVLLLDPDASKHAVYQNLLCVDQLGNIVWTADLPTSTDAYVNMTPTQEGIWANTWSGFRVLIDVNSGKQLSRVFAK